MRLFAEHIRYNRSFPLYSPTDNFDLLETDPRPIDHDLGLVSLYGDPKMYLWLWKNLEREYSIFRTGQEPLQIRFLLSKAPGAHPLPDIITCEDAMEYVQQEEKSWRDLFRFGGPLSGMKNPDKAHGLQNEPISVVGFWLFDVDAFGEMPDLPPPFSRSKWGMKHDFNLTGHRPQLGVFRLPP